ncbi:MAG: hypothetical protein WBN01_02630, partial [Polyangiales bacterium]
SVQEATASKEATRPPAPAQDLLDANTVPPWYPLHARTVNRRSKANLNEERAEILALGLDSLNPGV